MKDKNPIEFVICFLYSRSPLADASTADPRIFTKVCHARSNVPQLANAKFKHWFYIRFHLIHVHEMLTRPNRIPCRIYPKSHVKINIAVLDVYKDLSCESAIVACQMAWNS